MCLIAWNWQPDSETPLLLLANRDEYYARATRPVHWWPGNKVLAGQDLQAGGTWLGVSRNGRLAAITNYRMPVNDPAPRPSRGTLVADFLQGERDASDYLNTLALKAECYNPFNLLLFDGVRLMGLESRRQRVFSLLPGTGAVSNADFDTPWPKLTRLKARLQSQCLAAKLQTRELLPLLQDATTVADALLPQTGVSLEVERRLSATWIASPGYGTRASSIVTWKQDSVSVFEQGYCEAGLLESTQHSFVL
jgi:uncharacterized protein with NRDE domain